MWGCRSPYNLHAQRHERMARCASANCGVDESGVVPLATVKGVV